jgi:capsular exopolysaccharide synthesis family protein
MLPSSQLREVNIKDYLVILKRRSWVILIAFSFFTIRATIDTMKKVPQYHAIAKILIETKLPDIAPVPQAYAPSGWERTEYIKNQLNILTSRTLATAVVQNLIESGDNTFSGNQEPARAFLGGVTVEIVPGTQLVNVGYISRNPVQATKFTNALVNVYIQQDIKKRTEAGRYASGWLEAQLGELRKKLEASEVALNEFMKKEEAFFMPNVEERTHTVLGDLKQQKIEIENEIIELSKRYKSKHPTMLTLQTRLQAVRDSMDEETKKLLEMNTKMIEYNVLKREVDSNKNIYDSLLRRTKETEVSKELETTTVSIVDLADVPKSPFSPNRKRDISSGVTTGLILGLVFAFVLEYLDSTVKTAEDIEMYVRLPFLGYVPSARREAKSEQEIDLMAHKSPRSRITEAYRSVRTSIIFSSPEDRPLKTILVTSTSPQEGKTTVTINLGIVFAHANEKTLIVEGDLRKPRISASFGIENNVGVSSYLTGNKELEEVIKSTFVPNLFIIPSGPKPPNPSELLSSTKANQFLEELKKKFDRIFIDSPPTFSVADSVILANKVDGVIDIIRSGFLNIDIILRGRQRLSEAKARILGVILNNVDVKREDAYYYYHYYYSYSEEKEKKTST